MHLNMYEYIALNSKGLQILGCVHLFCWHLIGIFRRAFERPDAQENKKETAIHDACGIQNSKNCEKTERTWWSLWWRNYYNIPLQWCSYNWVALHKDVVYPLFHGTTALVNLGLHIIEFWPSNSDIKHSVELLWTSKRSIAETST